MAITAGGMAGAAAGMPIVELRRYRTKPGKRDELIALFEREFVESQEAVGMSIIGTFREPERPDNFTWLRGFTDMAARETALTDFYFGPVWKAHREAANACIDDNDDVLLMHQAWEGAGFKPDHSPRRAPGEGPERGPGHVVVRECWPVDAAAFAGSTGAGHLKLLSSQGVDVVRAFTREPSTNTFPRLPVREGEDFFVWFERYADGQPIRPAPDLPGLKRPVETLVLEPTRRSRLHG